MYALKVILEKISWEFSPKAVHSLHKRWQQVIEVGGDYIYDFTHVHAFYAEQTHMLEILAANDGSQIMMMLCLILIFTGIHARTTCICKFVF